MKISVAISLSTYRLKRPEFAALHFPIDRIFEAQLWVQAALTWVLKDMVARKDHMALINEFSIKVINNFADYQVPVITLRKGHQPRRRVPGL